MGKENEEKVEIKTIMANQNKKRVPLQVSPEFRIMLKNLQRKIIASGMDTSLRDLTEEMAKTPILFDELERKILNSSELNLNIRFDRRKR